MLLQGLNLKSSSEDFATGLNSTHVCHSVCQMRFKTTQQYLSL